MNVVTMVARLTRDVELKYVGSNNTALATFGIAVDSGYGDKKRTCFIDCKCWGKRGEALSNMFTKGREIAIRAELDLESWDDKDTGKKRYKHTLNVQDWWFVGPKQGGQQQQQQQQRPAQREPVQEWSPDNEVPF